MPRDALIRPIVRALPRARRLYATVRFLIIRPTLLRGIDRRLPSSGPVLDLGCGVGLFTLWMAGRRRGNEFVGLDTDARRIADARRAAAALDVRNATFECADIRSWSPAAPLAAVFAVDLLHHLPPDAVGAVLDAVRRVLKPGGVLVAKDVDHRPAAARWMCRLTDFVGSPGQSASYASAEAWAARLEQAGFERVRIERLTPPLPYPHILLVSSAPG